MAEFAQKRANSAIFMQIRFFVLYKTCCLSYQSSGSAHPSDYDGTDVSELILSFIN